jgi:hypothetical protein
LDGNGLSCPYASLPAPPPIRALAAKRIRNFLIVISLMVL